MEKKLKDLSWKPMWVSHLGCVKGCLDYLKIPVSDAWLFGATGHAFIINIHEVVCPSGPTAWNSEMLFKLANNIGYKVEGVVGFKSDPAFAEKQKLAWETVRQAIDNSLPCFGWELNLPEYYVVPGYDDTGYFFSGAGGDTGTGQKPWQELGATKIGVLEMYRVEPGSAAADRTTVKEALTFALEHSRSPSNWLFPKYKAGIAGFDTWIAALETGKADGFGMAYNAAVWSECRELAVDFLKEAKDRIGGTVATLFDTAIEPYGVVAENLKKITALFPFHQRKPEHIQDRARVESALELLRAARSAEQSGLAALEKLQQQL
jgi:hypothetical protein